LLRCSKQKYIEIYSELFCLFRAEGVFLQYALDHVHHYVAFRVGATSHHTDLYCEVKGSWGLSFLAWSILEMRYSSSKGQCLVQTHCSQDCEDPGFLIWASLSLR